MTASFNISQLANKVNTDGKLDASTGLYNQVPQANGGTGATSLASVAVTSLTAGTGISLSGSTGAITVTNTGGAGGATETTSATDITLTNSSNRAQKASFTADNKGFVLPDATTISAVGYPIFALSNNGFNNANIYSSDGGKIGSVSNGSTQAIGLSNNSNASTGWFGAGAMQVKAYANANISFATACLANFDSNNSNGFDVSPLSDSAFIFAYVNTAFDVIAVVGTISGTTITFGTPVLVEATTVDEVAVVGLSATSALIFNHGSGIKSFGLTISGNTITTVSTGSATISSVSMPSVTKIDSTRAILGYTSGTANSARIVTFNGASAPTFGTAVTLIAASRASLTSTLSAFALIDTDKVVAFYSDSDSSEGITFGDFARVCSISGTTITLGGQTVLSTTISTGGSSNTQALAISTTEAWCSNGYAVSISGTTVTSLVPAGGNPDILRGTKTFALLGSSIVSRVAGNNIVLNKYTSPYLLEGGSNSIANKPTLGKCVDLDANTFVAIGSAYQTNFPTYNLGAIVIKTNI